MTGHLDARAAFLVHFGGKKMRKTLITAGVLAVMTLQVQAQPSDLDGWFAGFDAGYIHRERISTRLGNASYGGPTIGLSAGRWWQLDPVYLGFDVGASLGGAFYREQEVIPEDDYFYRFDLQDALTVSLRAKAGVPVGPGLMYAAAGLRYVHMTGESTYEDENESSFDRTMNVEGGATLALGYEQSLMQNLSVKAEVGVGHMYVRPTIQYVDYYAKFGLNYYFD